MTELQTQIMQRTEEALSSLRLAEADGDDHLASVRLGELESLARTAHDHDLVLPQLDPFAPARA